MPPPPPPPVWKPPLFGTQWAVWDDKHTILLIEGTRWGGKTIAALWRIIRHLWETPGAHFGIFAKSVKLAKDGGSWQILLEKLLPIWISAQVVGKDGQPSIILTKTAEGNPGPKVDANTRTAYFDIRNYYGGRSRCSLFSINNENEIEDKVKNKEFSGMYFVELSMWKERKLLPITINQLRMTGFAQAEDYLLWMADTNPDEVLGRNSWIYQVFHVERNKPPRPDETDEEAEMLAKLYQQMHVIHMHWKDNPYMTEKQKVRLYATCRGDKALKEAYYDGVWGAGGFMAKYHFRHLFNIGKHVVGGGPGEEDQIYVNGKPKHLYAGWDTGGINHAVVLLDKWPRIINGREVSCWSVLDAIVHIGSRAVHDDFIKLEDFTMLVMTAMRRIEEREERDFEWIHWSDDSALNVFRPGSDSAYDYLEILKASGNTIHLQGVTKPARSRSTRVRMVGELLMEERLFVSSRCQVITEMFTHLAQTKTEYLCSKDNNAHNHPFDALSYPIFAEMQDELREAALNPVASKGPPSQQAIISL